MSNIRSLLHPLSFSKDIYEGLDPDLMPAPDDSRKRAGESAEDAALIQAMQGGCEQSFDLLFARYWKLVFSIAWKILRQRTESEDVVQDVFLAIYQQSAQYDPCRASVRTWIAQFAYYKALLRRRSLQVAAAANLDELKEFEIGLSRFGQMEDVLERAAFVEQCLAVVNPRQRRLLELVHFDGYTLTEAATILKQSLPNTRNLYYRGLNALRIQMQGQHLPSSRIQPQLNEALPERGSQPLILGRTCRP